jgi:hypothetical protein
MADEPQDDDEIPVPLGAQVLKRMHGALKALHGECSKAVGALDDCEAKALIGEHMGTMETSFGAMAKAFGKLYKDVDLEDEEEEKKPEDKKKPEDDDKKEPERQIEKADDPEDDDDEDDNLTAVEKSLLLSKIRQFESKVRHEERLQRMARLRAVR